MSVYTIKCRRTKAIIQFENHDLELFKAQFYNINGFDDNFYDHYDIIEFNNTPNPDYKGSTPILEFDQHEVGRRLPPTVEYNDSGFPPLNIFFL